MADTKETKKSKKGLIALIVIGSIIFVGLSAYFIVAGRWGYLFLFWLIALAAIFLKFSRATEGTAKAIMRFGALKKIVPVWRGYHLNDEGNVVPGGGWRPLGGLFFVGIRGMDSIYRYGFRRTGVKLTEGGKVESETKKEEEIDYILVRADTYPTIIKGAETTALPGPNGASAERFPIDATFLVTIRVKNPEKALFKAPPNWLENALARLNTLFIRWVGTKTFDQLISLMRIEDEATRKKTLWDQLDPEELVRDLHDKWGLEILKDGIDLGDVTPPPSIQEAADAEKRLALEARGRMASTAGLVLNIMAAARGKTVEEIQKDIAKDDTMRQEFIRRSMDLVVREMGIKGKSYVDIRVEGARGVEKALINLLSVWKRMPVEGGASGQPKGSEEKKEKSETVVKGDTESLWRQAEDNLNHVSGDEEDEE